MQSDFHLQKEVIKFQGSSSAIEDDKIAVEAPLEIRLAHPLKDGGVAQRIAITMRTPGQDEVLALGFLFTEGIIKGMDEVDHCELKDNEILTVFLKSEAEQNWEGIERKVYTSSSCGICGKADINSISKDPPYLSWSSSLEINAKFLYELPQQFGGTQSLFNLTGGSHAAVLVNGKGEQVGIAEDVGRHNAMDKLLGAALQSRLLPLSQHVVLLSGRASFELVQKAAMAGVPILCAVGAPSSMAIATAEEHGMTIVGFLKADRFNVYCGKRVQQI